MAEAQAVSLAPAPAPARPLDASIEACDDLLKALQTDLLSVPTATFSSKFSSRATVGVMFHGNIIESMVVGGPAFNCQELDRGDELLRVDGQPVTEQSRHRLLVGSDLPGSQVTLTVRKVSGVIKDVVLSRMKSEQIADKRRIFELFTTILDLVAGYDERQVRVSAICMRNSFQISHNFASSAMPRCERKATPSCTKRGRESKLTEKRCRPRWWRSASICGHV